MFVSKNNTGKFRRIAVSEVQKQGMSLIEQGMQQLINNEVQPQVDKIKQDIGEAAGKFEQIEIAANKSLEEAKSLVESTISGKLQEVRGEVAKGLKDQEEYISDNQQCIGNAMSRIKELEKNILGKVNLCSVDNGEKENDVIEFKMPNKVKSVTYEIEGAQHVAKFENGKFSGPHITSSEDIEGKHRIKFNRKLGDGSTFSMQLDTQNVIERVSSLEKKCSEQSKLLEGLGESISQVKKSVDSIEGVLKAFAEMVNQK